MWFLHDYMDDPMSFGRVFDPISIGTSAALAAGSAGASYLFGKKASKDPVPAPVTALPDQTDPAALEARKREQEQLLSRSGRQSTILAADRPAGGAYSGSVLGN
jgi:hypothetical protein